MMNIRLAKPEDLHALRRVAIETQVDTFGAYNSKENMDAFLQQAYDPDKLAEELIELDSRNYVLFDESELAGFMRLRKSNEVEHLLGANTIELQRLYVLRSHHGKGMGSALMKLALDYALEKKYDWMWLGVWEKNFRAQEFYTQFGFVRFSEHIFQMGDDPQTDWLLGRRIG